VQIARPGLRVVAGAVIALGIAWVVGLASTPPSSSGSGSPQRARRRAAFIEYNVRMTRRAYDLDRVVEKDFPVAETLDARCPRAERRDRQEHPPLGLPATAPHLRPAAGDPDLYKFVDVDNDRT